MLGLPSGKTSSERSIARLATKWKPSTPNALLCVTGAQASKLFVFLREFLRTLTDPCVLDRACVAPWIPDPSEAPDDNQLNARDGAGNLL